MWPFKRRKEQQSDSSSSSGGDDGSWDNQLDDPWSSDGGGGVSGGAASGTSPFEKPFEDADNGSGDTFREGSGDTAVSLDDGAGHIDEGLIDNDSGDGGGGNQRENLDDGGAGGGGDVGQERRQRGGGAQPGGKLVIDASGRIVEANTAEAEKAEREALIRERLQLLMNNPMTCVVIGGAALVQGGVAGTFIGGVIGVIQGRQMGLRGTQLSAFSRGQAVSSAKMFAGYLAVYEGSKCCMIQLRKKDDVFNAGFAGFTTGFVTSIARRQPPSVALISGLTFGLGIMVLSTIT